MHRLILVDLPIVVLPAMNGLTPTIKTAEQPVLAVRATGGVEEDGQRRFYYAALPPHRLLIVMRCGRPIEDVAVAQWLRALVGWDAGDHAYVLPGDANKRHTKLTVDEVLVFNAALPDEPVTSLSHILARAPRSDRPGGQRADMPGRPPVAPGDPVEAHNITLPSRLWRRVERLGAGNRSAGVRKLAEQAPEEVSPVQLPYDVRRALRAFPGGTAAAAEINGLTAIIVKTAKRDADSAHRPGVRVAFRSELGLYPSAAVIRLALEIHDKPDQPLKLDTFLDPAGAADYRLLRKLTDQDTLDLHIFDLEMSYQYTKRIPFRELPRRELSELLDQALSHNATLPKAARDWQAARDRFMADTQE